MGSDIAVSVIVPVYNAQDYLQDCLESICNQTLRNIEIICVDDGSTDCSLKILREYEKIDNRITVISQENINAGNARNVGLDLAKGEYLSFLDADDFFELDMLGLAYNAAIKHKADIIVFQSDEYDYFEKKYSSSRHALVSDNLPRIQPFAGVDVEQNIFFSFEGWAWDKLFLRKFIVNNQIRFQELRTTNDLFFTYYSLAKANRIATIENVLAHHRTHVQTSLEKTREKSWDCFYYALCLLKDRLQIENMFNHYEHDFINYSISFCLWNLYTISLPIQEKMFYALKYSWLEKLGINDSYDKKHIQNEDQYKEICAVIHGEYYEVFPDEKVLEINRLTEKAMVYETAITQYKNEISQNRDEILRYRNELETKANELLAIKSSISYRLGRSITYIPRVIRDKINEE